MLRPADGPYQYVILSRTTHNGMPEFNRHTLAESANSYEAAEAYANVRIKSGYWVDIYKELAYAVPTRPSDD